MRIGRVDRHAPDLIIDRVPDLASLAIAGRVYSQRRLNTNLHVPDRHEVDGRRIGTMHTEEVDLPLVVAA